MMRFTYTVSEFKDFLDSLPDTYRLRYIFKIRNGGYVRGFDYLRLLWLYKKLPKKKFQEPRDYLQSRQMRSFYSKLNTEISLSPEDKKTKDIMYYFYHILEPRIPNWRKNYSFPISAVRDAFMEAVRINHLENYDVDS